MKNQDIFGNGFGFRPINLNIDPSIQSVPYHLTREQDSNSKNNDKVRVITYIDGPFFINEKLSKKENQNKLCDEIYECMKKRSENSTYKYIEYIPK